MTKKERSRLLLSLISIVLLMAMMIFMSSVETNYYSDYTTNRYTTLSSSCNNTPSSELIKYFNTSMCRFEIDEYDRNGNPTGEKYIFDDIQVRDDKYVGIVTMKVEQDDWIYFRGSGYSSHKEDIPFVEISFYDPQDGDDREIKYLQSATLTYTVNYTDKHGFLWLSSTHYSDTVPVTISMNNYEEGLDNPSVDSDFYWGAKPWGSDGLAITSKSGGGYFHTTGTTSRLKENQIYRLDANTFMITLPSFSSMEGIYGKDKFDKAGDIEGSVVDFEYVLEDLEVDEVNTDIEEQYYQLLMNVTNDDTLTYEEKMIRIIQLEAQYSSLGLSYDQVLLSQCGETVDDSCEFYIEAPATNDLSDLLFLGLEFGTSVVGTITSIVKLIFIILICVALFPLMPVIVPTIIAFFKAILGMIKPIVVAVYKFIIDLVTWFVNWLTSGLLPVFQKHVPKIWVEFKHLLYNVGQFLQTMWNGTIDFFRKYGGTVWKQFKALMSEIGQLIHQVWLQIKGFFTGFRK